MLCYSSINAFSLAAVLKDTPLDFNLYISYYNKIDIFYFLQLIMIKILTGSWNDKFNSLSIKLTKWVLDKKDDLIAAEKILLN